VPGYYSGKQGHATSPKWTGPWNGMLETCTFPEGMIYLKFRAYAPDGPGMANNA
jgi:hypothetical protein